VTGPNAAAALDRVAANPRVHEILGRGVNKTSVKLGREGLQVDVRALEHASFGAAMQYFTGSKEHNVALRQRAIRMGFKLSEYGLFRAEDDTRVAGETEEEVYAALGLDWIPPELRENNGEIELAEAHALPKLVTQADLRGDLHMHTTATDGRATLEEMAEAGRALGYEYVAITDHSKAIAMAFGLDEKRVVEFAATVRKINETGNLGIRVLSGLECDIMKDGDMDIAWDALAELDIVIGSVHSHMGLEPDAMTDRLLRALECPHLKALGHPTGRLLLHRDAFTFDFDRVIGEAVRRGVWLEVNSSPERLDLSANHVRAAKAKGAKFIVSTDAHHPKHLLNMKYGILTARRGGLEAADIVNSYPTDQFVRTLRKRE
jgi:DNA polymerase (family 10)